ncbi:hypothetical protein R6L23_36545 [Streptomyces sp. SR27]|uniref:hypothetical protein n=1 Tax=unclassified Streptomyces TaxID=2593676 RepID=UPI00295A730F|nr:hypothetical protein [Streptomyces sp. SR27]MDV9193657.1 hypothetical protein [Streptomyces sp. SR27]
MFERTEWATGIGRGARRSPRLPDLAAVDLRTLRVSNDAVLGEAVERVLRDPSDLVVSWPEDAFVD